jgi:hypothetical protein
MVSPADSPGTNDYRTKAAARQKRYRDEHREEIRARDRARDRKDYYSEYRRDRDDKPDFVGVDGEGGNLSNGYHAYFMLRAGDHLLSAHSDDVRLRTYDTLSFLSDLSPKKTYVAFFFDYDVAKILEDLPFKRLQYLMDRDARARDKGGWFPVAYGDFEIDYMPRKEFKVRRKDGGAWITIHDVGSFFQCSFIKALDLWEIGTDKQRALIADGKGKRADFSRDLFQEIANYNHLECILLRELMGKFADACRDIGYVPKKWQGPGLLAEAMLEKHGLPRTADLPIFNSDPTQDGVVDSPAGFGRMAFYGGRFETSIVGATPPDVRQNDINSAYPAALLQVPCLEHGTWTKTTDKRKVTDDETSICFGTFRWPRRSSRPPHFMGFPVRTSDGSIRFPMDGKGWYWSHEIRAAKHQTFTVLESWVYERHCECQPFAFVADIYKERKRLGKNAKGMVLKLAMNSLYGKMAQSIGTPKFSNPIWASFITAWCRAKIQDAIHQSRHCATGKWCGSDVYMIATDALVTRWDIPNLDIGDGLGQWSVDVHDEGLFIIQPGLYFPVNVNKEAMYKTRGVPKAMVIEYREQFITNFAKMKESKRVMDGDVLLPMTLFIGIRQALQRHSLKLLGQFVPYNDPVTGEPGRRTSFDWITKRRPQPYPLPEFKGTTPSPYILTSPYFGTEGEQVDGTPIQTFPYSKDIGGLVARMERQTEFEDQPDWMPTL